MAADSKTVGMDFTTGLINKQLVKFLVPFLLASVLNSLYNTVDMMIIGKYVGSIGTVAVSNGGKMMDMFNSFAVGLAAGGQIYISQLVGAKKKEDINATIGTFFSGMFLFSVALAVFCIVFSGMIVSWMDTPAESHSSALAYMRITSIGLPFTFGYNAVSSVLRGMGNSRQPLLFIAIAAASNVVLDIVFIAIFDMGAAGTALATIIGQGISVVFSLVYLYRRRERFGFDFKPRSFAIDTAKLMVISKLGFPQAIRLLLISFTQLYVMKMVNAFGLVQSAAFNIGYRIINMLNICCASTRQAAGAMVGQNIGAGRQDRVVETVKWARIIAMSYAAVISALSVIFPYLLFSFFTSEAEVMAYSKTFMYITVFMYFLAASLMPYEAVITGIGNSRLNMLNGILDGVVCRLFFCYLFGIWLDMEVVGLFLGNCMGKTVPLLVSAIYYHSGKWKKYKRLV